MIIDCPECNKKFEIDSNLIPIDGRLLQCGNCNHKWFFKLNNIEKIVEKKKIETTEDTIVNNKIPKKKRKEEIIDQSKNKNQNETKSKNINYFNILLVIIISIIAFILILDTFKYQLTLIFPNIDFFLNNLYQSLEDIKLFIIDLIK
tara:strand:- start:436 stop:876 length:441 start_codon:yes stop_codon:yes gene_type:complete